MCSPLWQSTHRFNQLHLLICKADISGCDGCDLKWHKSTWLEEVVAFTLYYEMWLTIRGLGGVDNNDRSPK